MNQRKIASSLILAMFRWWEMRQIMPMETPAGNLPALHVEGKDLKDAAGKKVVLHGVMDTPTVTSTDGDGSSGRRIIRRQISSLVWSISPKSFWPLPIRSRELTTAFRLHMDLADQ